MIIGEGEDRPKIEQAIRTLNNVYLLAFQPRNLMPEIISSADLCTVLLSMEPIFSVAFPTKFYEYIACNKPVIAICKGELSEVINFNKIGYAVAKENIDDLVQFIKTIKDSSDLLTSTEQNVKNVLYRYSLNNISLKLGSILKTEFRSK